MDAARERDARDAVEAPGRSPPAPATPAVRSRRARSAEGIARDKLLIDNGAGAQIPPGCSSRRARARSRHPLPPLARGPVRPGQGRALAGRAGQERQAGRDARARGLRRPRDRRLRVRRAVGLGPDGPKQKGKEEETSLSKAFLWMGRSLWGMMVRDDQIALDVLAARPEVDPKRIGATGISMGSTRTLVAGGAGRPGGGVGRRLLPDALRGPVRAGRPARARHLLFRARDAEALRHGGGDEPDRAAAVPDAVGSRRRRARPRRA
jgi:hypothetical protein